MSTDDVDSEQPDHAPVPQPRRPWREGRLPRSSLRWEGELPDEDSPPWVCLDNPGAPLVLRRYDPTSRTCDVIADHGRWVLESALVPRVPVGPRDLQLGWDVAVGDVQPGWCIVYAGDELWFPQRVLRVDVVDDQWQRVWTLGDLFTRNVWGDDTSAYERDHGRETGWSYDEMRWPFWEDEVWETRGPWWPLQSPPLSDNVRRFVLDKFDIAVECPDCGAFGRPIVYGMVLDPDPWVEVAGCVITGDDPCYRCDCGAGWSVTDQGRVHPSWGVAFDREEWRRDLEEALNPDHLNPETELDEAGEADTADVDELNYDWNDTYPYGEKSELFFQDVQGAMYEAAGGGTWGEVTDNDDDLYIRYWGQDRYDAEEMDQIEAITDAQRQRAAYF
jgi:hypothetical protein